MRRSASFTAGLAAGLWAGTWYVKWRSLPTFTGSDASGVFGDPEAPALSIAVLGDSSCTGPGLDRIDDVWIQRIGRVLGEEFRTTIDSFAVGGAQAHDVLSEQVPRVNHHDVAIVAVGPNDMLYGVSPSAFRTRLESIVDAVPADAVVLSGVGDLSSIPRLPAVLRWAAHARGRAADRAHEEVAAARSHVFKVPIWDRATDFHRDRSLWAADLFHASADGHAVYADVAMPAIRSATALVTGRRAGNPTTR